MGTSLPLWGHRCYRDAATARMLPLRGHRGHHCYGGRCCQGGHARGDRGRCGQRGIPPLQGCCHYGDAAVMRASPWGTSLPRGCCCHRGQPHSHWGHCHQGGYHCSRDAASMGTPPPQGTPLPVWGHRCQGGHHRHGEHCCHGDAATLGDTTTLGTSPARGHHHPGEAATTGARPPLQG